jgi:hypothetical protein
MELIIQFFELHAASLNKLGNFFTDATALGELSLFHKLINPLEPSGYYIYHQP